MPKFAANLSMMFNEWGFLDRFDAAADAGFEYVEYLFPYDFPADEIAKKLEKNKLTQALFNLPPGDWAKGDRGIAAIGARYDEFKAGLAKALTYAKATKVKRLHLMAGNAPAADASAKAAYEKALAETATFFGPHGIDIVIEPINKRDMPAYFLNDYPYAVALIERLKLPNLKLQYDFYHRAILHGDVIMGFRQLLPIVGHVQIASVPGRNEPDGEELNYPYIFAEMDKLGYAGFVGLEYKPRGKTLDGLAWFQPYKRK